MTDNPQRELSAFASRIHRHMLGREWLTAAEVAGLLKLNTDIVERELIFLMDGGHVTMRHGVPRQYRAS